MISFITLQHILKFKKYKIYVKLLLLLQLLVVYKKDIHYNFKKLK